MQDGDPAFAQPAVSGSRRTVVRFGRIPADSDGAPRYLATPPRRIARPPRECSRSERDRCHGSGRRHHGLTHHGADQKGEPDHGPLCGLAEEEVLAAHMNGTLPRLVRSAPGPISCRAIARRTAPLVSEVVVLSWQDPGQPRRLGAAQIGGARRDDTTRCREGMLLDVTVASTRRWPDWMLWTFNIASCHGGRRTQSGSRGRESGDTARRPAGTRRSGPHRGTPSETR